MPMLLFTKLNIPDVGKMQHNRQFRPSLKTGLPM